MKKSYHSSFVIDVSVDVEAKTAVLSDSANRRFTVDLDNDSVKIQFAEWLKTVFMPGKSGIATVFQYEQRGNPADMEMHIVKFLNLPKTENSDVSGISV